MHTVIHQAENQRFIIDAQPEAAVLQYVMLNDQEIDFTRTYVPPALRGQGLAEALVRTGLKWAKQESYSIHASCWYVAKFL